MVPSIAKLCGRPYTHGGALVTRFAALFGGLGPPVRTGPEIEEATRRRRQEPSCGAIASPVAEDEPQPE